MAEAVRELNDGNFQEEIKKSEIAFVDFYASWCGPCRLFAPIFEEVAGGNSDVRFYKIDGDLNPESRASLEISSLPYVAAYRNGEFIEGLSTTTKSGLVNFMQTILDRPRVAS